MTPEPEMAESEMAYCLPMPSTDLSHLPSSNLKQIGTDPGELSLAVDKKWFWDVGQSLHVRFLNKGTSCRHEKMVEDAAKIWQTYANIQFVFDNAVNAEIRIQFDKEHGGGSSLIGRYQEEADKHKHTMMLGLKVSDQVFRKVALHELGHALGCIHEHSSPVANIQWNEKAVIEWHKARGRNEEWVRSNVFQHYEPKDSLQTTNFDERSIMIYQILPGWAKNITYITWPDELSEADKMLIRRVYRPIMATTEIGTYSTQESRVWDQPNGQNVKRISFLNPQNKDLDFAIGITHFDLDCEGDVHLKAYAETIDTIDTKSFNLHLDSMEGATQYSAAATCLVSERHNPLLQTGSYTTSPEHTTNGNRYIAPIKFADAFKKPPGLVVWLSAFHFNPEGDFNVTAYADNKNEKEFNLCIETWGNASLKSAEASWIAYEKDPPGIHSYRLPFHNFEQSQQRHGDDKLHCIRSEKLGEWQPTMVYAAISKFSFARGHNPRLSVSARPTEESVEGRPTKESAIEVDVKTWSTSECNEVEVSYLAVCI